MTEKFFTKEHEWIVIDGTSGTIGITQYAQEQLGDVVHVDLPEIGKTVAAGDEIAVVESVKAASELFSPVSGKIGEVNNMVINNPSIINSSPEDEGWFIKMEITNKSELEDLMDETSYMKFLKESE
jgi:glycine cleavage system H protein